MDVERVGEKVTGINDRLKSSAIKVRTVMQSKEEGKDEEMEDEVNKWRIYETK